MTQKKKLYSLLAILLSVTLLVTGIICALIFWLAQQSTQNFENFIVESRQQEINSAVHSFSTDVDTLLLLMQTELNDSALTRLQLYYDSRIFNYDYLSQTTAVRNQISIIENSMPFTETLEICMLDSMRKVAWGSIATLDDDTMEMISETLGSGTRGMTLDKRLAALPEYKDAFISGSDAFIKAQPGALLVVVDTNRPDFVESEQLLDTCNRVAVIDHHRRAASYIESAALNFHEPYASSASELVSELLQYLIDPGDLLRAEAEALFAGIVLDTKNFTMRTGGRTFEAAALLRRVGVDTADVQRLFQGTLSDMIERYDIIRHAELYHNDIAIAAVEQDIDRVTAAKAADELLTLRGVRASFVLFKHDTGVNLSARSLGEINVQLIMEKLGGGGNSTTAGGQIPDGTVDAVREQLIAAIDQYLEG